MVNDEGVMLDRTKPSKGISSIVKSPYSISSITIGVV
jgi:hypothetical protein